MLSENFSFSLLGPAIVLVILAWIVPSQLAKRMPETMLALATNLAVSAVIIWIFSALGFAASYAAQGVPWSVMIANPEHFIWLGQVSALLWGPVLLLVLALQPQKWRPEL
ncbi:MAG: hypothetical protein AAGA15_13775 [Pseudomonadota bacterium]